MAQACWLSFTFSKFKSQLRQNMFVSIENSARVKLRIVRSFRVSIRVNLVIRHKFQLRITPKILHTPVVLESHDWWAASIWDSKATWCKGTWTVASYQKILPSYFESPLDWTWHNIDCDLLILDLYWIALFLFGQIRIIDHTIQQRKKVNSRWQQIRA